MKAALLGLVSSSLLVLASCASAPAASDAMTTKAADVATMDIVDTAVAAGSFKTLAAALTAAGLIDTLKGPGPFTVFAPNDDAFAKIPAADLDALLADKEKLTAVLMLHVVPGRVAAADVMKLADGTMVKTAGGAEVKVGNTMGGVTVNGVKVIATDINATNGVIHVVDSVIMPQG